MLTVTKRCARQRSKDLPVLAHARASSSRQASPSSAMALSQETAALPTWLEHPPGPRHACARVQRWPWQARRAPLSSVQSASSSRVHGLPSCGTDEGSAARVGGTGAAGGPPAGGGGEAAQPAHERTAARRGSEARALTRATVQRNGTHRALEPGMTPRRWPMVACPLMVLMYACGGSSSAGIADGGISPETTSASSGGPGPDTTSGEGGVTTNPADCDASAPACPVDVPARGAPCSPCAASCSYDCAHGNGSVSTAKCVNGAWTVLQSAIACEAPPDAGGPGPDPRCPATAPSGGACTGYVPGGCDYGAGPQCSLNCQCSGIDGGTWQCHGMC
jgi:hypothetical protein